MAELLIRTGREEKIRWQKRKSLTKKYNEAEEIHAGMASVFKQVINMCASKEEEDDSKMKEKDDGGAIQLEDLPINDFFVDRVAQIIC